MLSPSRIELEKALRAGLLAFQPPDKLSLSEWADRNFHLSAESSYREEAWKSWPFQVGLLDVMGNDDVREVVFQKSARVGYSKMLLAAIGYFAQHQRRNQALWQPTDDDADEWVKTELDTMLRDVPVMASAFPEYARRDKRNTLRQKHFIGSMLFIRGGKAAKNYRRLSVDVAHLDEIDGFDADIEKEGDPVTLARKRVEGATWPKLIVGSTPKLANLSLVNARYRQADARFRFVIPCPSCGEEHSLEWQRMKWDKGDPESVRQICPECGVEYRQSDYLAVAARGRWKSDSGLYVGKAGRFFDAENREHKIPSVAFFLWTAYSPMVMWPNIVRAYASAQAKADVGDRSELKSFINTTLGEPYKEESFKANETALSRRAESYKLRTAPEGALFVTAGIDVQFDRWECFTWAWGRGEESWAIDHEVIWGDPARETEWAKLDEFLERTYPAPNGWRLGIDAAAVDTGGHFTHQSYNFCRVRMDRKVFAVKGDSRAGQPVRGRVTHVDVNAQNRVIKRGLPLHLVGVDTAKNLFFGRLGVTERGAGYVHFSKDLTPEYFAQITSEERVVQMTKRGERSVWVPIRRRNEALDGAVYAMFAAHAIGLDKAEPSRWRRRELELADAANPVKRTSEPVATARRTAPTFGSEEWSSRL